MDPPKENPDVSLVSCFFPLLSHVLSKKKLEVLKKLLEFDERAKEGGCSFLSKTIL